MARINKDAAFSKKALLAHLAMCHNTSDISQAVAWVEERMPEDVTEPTDDPPFSEEFADPPPGE